ncbi:DUF4198 domain-containing protein [bacterium]|nr:DUF4198 domain-containing protein [bacterium]
MKKIGIVAFSLLFSIHGMTHDLFLRPASFVLAGPGELKLSMWLSEAFPGKEQKWRSDKTVSTIVKGPGGLQKIPNVPDASATVSLKQTGTYVIGWEATPSYIKIDALTFNKYLEAEYKSALQMRKQRGEEQKEGTEKYFRYLKSIVQVGAQRTDDPKQPVGHKIELIPLSNPYEVHAGNSLEFQLLFEGKPLSDAKAFATYDTFSKEHDVYAQTVESGPDGKLRIQIDQPGLWMVRANHILPLAADSKAEWVSYWANVTFEIAK